MSLTYEERIIENMRREVATLQTEKAELQKGLNTTQSQARIWELKCRDAERRAFNAEQHAKLADACIKELKHNQGLLFKQIEMFNALQKPPIHGN